MAKLKEKKMQDLSERELILEVINSKIHTFYARSFVNPSSIYLGIKEIRELYGNGIGEIRIKSTPVIKVKMVSHIGVGF